METPGRVSDLMPKSLAPEGWMTELWAAAASTWRVTSCSISSAEVPGQGVTALATRTGITGSLSFGMFR